MTTSNSKSPHHLPDFQNSYFCYYNSEIAAATWTGIHLKNRTQRTKLQEDIQYITDGKFNMRTVNICQNKVCTFLYKLKWYWQLHTKFTYKLCYCSFCSFTPTYIKFFFPPNFFFSYMVTFGFYTT